jgi:multiple sugar transport system ATP-binding protein
MGSPGMNFIECIVKDENLIIESGGEKYELSIPCKEAIKNSKLDVVMLGIRPEMMTEIQPSVEKSSFIHQIKFDVNVIEPMGADTVAIGQWNESEVMARLSPESGNTAGKGFDLQVDTSKAILFDPNSGLRIR